MIKGKASHGIRTEEQEFREKLEVLKEDRKDTRVKKQATEQSKLISQRQGERGELPETPEESEGGDAQDIINSIIDSASQPAPPAQQ